MENQTTTEPWLRGTHADVPAVLRAVIHALELAGEDLSRWCGKLNNAEINATPGDLAPVAFQIRHVARSIDRLLTYAEGQPLTQQQLALKSSELEPGAKRDELFAELDYALGSAAKRIGAFDTRKLDGPAQVGREKLPATIAGLLIHVADHTQRHVGQAITTAKIVLSQRT